MRAIVVGTGTIGTAVKEILQEQGHDVATVGRGSGDFRADISDIEGLKSLFATIGPFDAVANAAGDVFPGPLELTTDEQWTKSLRSKGMGQINLVRAALPYIADEGSFTLVSAIALMNGFLERHQFTILDRPLIERFYREWREKADSVTVDEALAALNAPGRRDR